MTPAHRFRSNSRAKDRCSADREQFYVPAACFPRRVGNRHAPRGQTNPVLPGRRRKLLMMRHARPRARPSLHCCVDG